MVRILQFAIMVFGFVCITGCPPPDRMNFVFDVGETGDISWMDSSYAVKVSSIYPWRMNRRKEITMSLGLHNKTKDSLRLICSNSNIYSKNDTFSLKGVGYSYFDNLNDTITFAPGDTTNLTLIFSGNKKYSYRLFSKTNRRDTFYLRLNLFDIDVFTFPMRNHHRGFIWNTY